MKSLTKAALIALLTTLPISCAQTHSSVDTDDLGDIQNTLIATGAQHDFLDGIRGEFDVIYNVWNSENRPCDTFAGTVNYQWNGQETVLIGQHDGFWADMPFQSAMLLSFDSASECYAMGWARQDGTMVLPLSPTDPYSPNGEMSVTRGSGDQCSRSVMVIEDSNTHTIRRYVTQESGHEDLVLEMICTRL
ncbi:MAG: DUF1579 family protein [Planctomycetota bacterium]|nr:DUF1579 family protein [Planctomycetota bacterium]